MLSKSRMKRYADNPRTIDILISAGVECGQHEIGESILYQSSIMM